MCSGRQGGAPSRLNYIVTDEREGGEGGGGTWLLDGSLLYGVIYTIGSEKSVVLLGEFSNERIHRKG